MPIQIQFHSQMLYLLILSVESKKRILIQIESQRAHWLRRARKLGSPLLAAGLASIKLKNSKLGSKIPRSLLRGIFNESGRKGDPDDY